MLVRMEQLQDGLVPDEQVREDAGRAEIVQARGPGKETGQQFTCIRRVAKSKKRSQEHLNTTG